MAESRAVEPRVRLAELLAALSLATDLGMGQPMDHALRTCLLATGLGRRLGLTGEQLSHVYYTALLRRTGCTSDSHELARLLGDDLAAHARLFTLDFGRPVQVLLDMLQHAGEGTPWPARAGKVAGALAAGREAPAGMFRASCEVAQGMARSFGLPESVGRALAQTFERWDGKGVPGGVKGEGIELAARIVHVAEDAEVFVRLGGVSAAKSMVRDRAGRSHDPEVAATFLEEAGSLGEELLQREAWDAVLEAEPAPVCWLTEERLEKALAALGDFADLKSPCFSGHSRNVADLAERAGEEFGLPQSETVVLRRAALVHDLGRSGVSNNVWDKPGPLTAAEWERVRLHPYYTERILSRSPALLAIGAVAGMHHERTDGSGYYRGITLQALPLSARILAAADLYQAMLEPRPHREALSPPEAESQMRSRVRAGRLDGDAVDSVLRAAGHRVRRRREWPAGLTPREVEVLRLIAAGLPTKAIARRLVVAEPTAAAHVQHIYEKIGVSTRAAAALFAMQQGLLSLRDLAEE